MSARSRNSLLASVLTSGLVMAVLLVAPSEAQRPPPATGAVAAAAGQQDDDERADEEQADDGAGGPQSWAHAHGKDKGHGPDKAWKEAWKKLTPAQKRDRMAALSKSHREGMEKWADCVAAAGEDKAEREKCVKPLPPGRAKKRSS